MLDHNGHIVKQEPCKKTLFVEADLGSLYKEPATWDQFNEIVDRIMMEDEEPSGNIDVLTCEVSSFSLSIKEQAILSNASMAFGATTLDKSACDIFETQLRDAIKEGFSTLLAVRAGQTWRVSAEHLAKIWRISHDDAAWTVEVTTQLLHTNDGSSLSRNAGMDDCAVRYKKLWSTFFSDTLFATKKAKSLRGNTCAQLFVLDKGFVAVYLMWLQSEYLLALKQFAKDVGVPEVLVCDSHPLQKAREVKQFLMSVGTTLSILEAETQWANCAELYVGLVKESTRKDMHFE
jgi:hypothetical protein